MHTQLGTCIHYADHESTPTCHCTETSQILKKPIWLVDKYFFDACNYYNISITSTLLKFHLSTIALLGNASTLKIKMPTSYLRVAELHTEFWL